MMESLERNCGRTTPPTIPLGKWRTSTAVLETAMLWVALFFESSMAIPSILLQMMEAQVMNCGRTTPPITQLGKWPTSTAVQETVTLEEPCITSLVIRCISGLTMEAPVMNCGRTTLPIIPPGK